MDAQGVRGELSRIRDVANDISADMNRMRNPSRTSKAATTARDKEGQQ